MLKKASQWILSNALSIIQKLIPLPHEKTAQKGSCLHLWSDETCEIVGEWTWSIGYGGYYSQRECYRNSNTPCKYWRNNPRRFLFGHLDTSAEQTADTKAQRLPYNGGDLCLNPELNIYLRESEFPELKNYIGDDLIVTDGTSLLGPMIKRRWRP